MSGFAGDAKAISVVVVIGAVCAAGLAFVKGQTEGAIKAARLQETAAAVERVVPAGCKVRLDEERAGATECPDYRKKAPATAGGKPGCFDVYPAYFEDGRLCAVAVRNSNTEGYGGRIEVLAGFAGLENEETLVLTRIYVLSHSETPGLGSLIATAQDKPPEEWGIDRKKVFGLNFRNRVLKDFSFTVKKGTEATEGEVMAITAATISSRAVTKAVGESSRWVKENLGAIREKLAAAPGPSADGGAQ